MVTADDGISSGGPFGRVTRPAGNSLTLVVTDVRENYLWDGWYEGSVRVSQNQSYQFIVTKNRELMAKTKPVTRLVTLQKGNGINSVSGGGNKPHGTTAHIVADAEQGYDFDGWYDGSTRVSRFEIYDFTVTADITLQARSTEHDGSVSGGSGGSGGSGDTTTPTPPPPTTTTTAPV